MADLDQDSLMRVYLQRNLIIKVLEDCKETARDTEGTQG